jgi:outer membrane receptor protein involved in Fe transport
MLPEHWTAEAYGNNLTDKIYSTGEGLNSGNYYFYGAPRQYGLRARALSAWHCPLGFAC